MVRYIVLGIGALIFLLTSFHRNELGHVYFQFSIVNIPLFIFFIVLYRVSNGFRIYRVVPTSISEEPGFTGKPAMTVKSGDTVISKIDLK